MSILLFVKISLTDFSLASSDTRRTVVRKVSRLSLIRSFASDGITWPPPGMHTFIAPITSRAITTDHNLA
jgi:hypothetical protein